MDTLTRFVDEASESDFKAAQLVLQPELRKLALLESRIDVYNCIGLQMEAYMFNEQRLPTSYRSKNEYKCLRTMFTFRQAIILCENISVRHLATDGKVVINWEDISQGYALSVYTFTNDASPIVYERKIHKQFLQIKHFEANWPGDAVGNRITPHSRRYKLENP